MRKSDGAHVEQLSRHLCEEMIKRNIINRKYEAVYAYGMRNLLMKSIVDLFMIIMGILFHVPLFTIAFYFSFTVIRSYYGGYHAKTRRRCFLITNAIFIINIMFAKYIYDGLNKKIVMVALFITITVFNYMSREKRTGHILFQAANIIFILYLIAEYLALYDLAKAFFSAILCGLFLYLISASDDRRTNT
jgi:accessory gene regulator B